MNMLSGKLDRLISDLLDNNIQLNEESFQLKVRIRRITSIRMF